MATVINDDDGFGRVVSLSGSAAQSLVNLLQAVCSYMVYLLRWHSHSYFYQRLDFWVDPVHKSRHVRALVQLSETSARYPDCLTLKGISIEGSPDSGSGLGDVYKGGLGGQEVAVKILRELPPSAMSNLREVYFQF